ncbi:ATP synthase F1 subunit gamma, partial [Xanthomarina gelatinilytica]
MANLKEIRNRISSVSSTMQITSAMKMVSAAKLKKAQDAITAMRPYADKLTELLQSLSATLDADSGSKFSDQREVKNVLIVAITSNRGLCGAFNSNIIKEVNKLSKVTYANKEVSYLAIGKKANDAFKKTNKVIANKSAIFDDLTFDNVADIAQMLMDKFVAGDFDKIVIVYNKFKNAATQEVMTEQFLPIVPVEKDANVNLDYIFEPSKIEIVEQL